jgi:hypothetical protein
MSRALLATTAVLGSVALGGTGLVLLVRSRRRAASPRGTEESRSRWRAVTINRTPEEVMPGGQRPVPLAELGDRVEVEVRPAPGGKGAELRARLTTDHAVGWMSRLAGSDPRLEVRAALRRSKQLLEVGEVLQVDPRPHGHRPSTLQGKLVDTMARRAGGEGVL